MEKVSYMWLPVMYGMTDEKIVCIVRWWKSVRLMWKDGLISKTWGWNVWNYVTLNYQTLVIGLCFLNLHSCRKCMQYKEKWSMYIVSFVIFNILDCQLTISQCTFRNSTAPDTESGYYGSSGVSMTTFSSFRPSRQHIYECPNFTWRCYMYEQLMIILSFGKSQSDTLAELWSLGEDSSKTMMTINVLK